MTEFPVNDSYENTQQKEDSKNAGFFEACPMRSFARPSHASSASDCLHVVGGQTQRGSSTSFWARRSGYDTVCFDTNTTTVDLHMGVSRDKSSGDTQLGSTLHKLGSRAHALQVISLVGFAGQGRPDIFEGKKQGGRSRSARRAAFVRKEGPTVNPRSNFKFQIDFSSRSTTGIEDPEKEDLSIKIGDRKVGKAWVAFGGRWGRLTEADQGSMCFVKSRSRNSQTIENIADDNQNPCGTAPLSAPKTLAPSVDGSAWAIPDLDLSGRDHGIESGGSVQKFRTLRAQDKELFSRVLLAGGKDSAQELRSSGANDNPVRRGSKHQDHKRHTRTTVVNAQPCASLWSTRKKARREAPRPHSMLNSDFPWTPGRDPPDPFPPTLDVLHLSGFFAEFSDPDHGALARSLVNSRVEQFSLATYPDLRLKKEGQKRNGGEGGICPAVGQYNRDAPQGAAWRTRARVSRTPVDIRMDRSVARAFAAYAAKHNQQASFDPSATIANALVSHHPYAIPCIQRMQYEGKKTLGISSPRPIRQDVLIADDRSRQRRQNTRDGICPTDAKSAKGGVHNCVVPGSRSGTVIGIDNGRTPHFFSAVPARHRRTTQCHPLPGRILTLTHMQDSLESMVSSHAPLFGP
ncbi:hypothetical protein B0J18DRAFT_476620 [Chaetomium sp. MPI-SDFR-AT-0129]|nr:hypothetical protein B0J18DRAFT_476620 [Chaetomium sp. MPI-SDFR-AT-0129]